MTSTLSRLSDPSGLTARRAALIQAEPQLRARDVAHRLGIAEAELVALGEDGVETLRLTPDWPGIVAAAGSLGCVMALTRNESCVHERRGVYGALEGDTRVGLIVGDDIDLRIFFHRWRFGFAVTEGARRSLQFFDGEGTAIHKIYLTETSDIAAFDRLAATFATEATPLAIEARPARAAPLADSAVDLSGFRDAWDALTDTHQFQGLLGRFKLERVQALRLAGERRARPVPPAALRVALHSAAERLTPIMIFVGNCGMIQIHTGPVANLKAVGPWFNVLDDDFNLHLREDRIASAWIVRKPTDDGIVTSLELFGADGEAIAMLFGKRKLGRPEDEGWRAIVAGLAAKEAA